MHSIQMTKLAKCAGCGAKVGAGTLSRLLGDLPTHRDENLLVGYDTSDDAAVYRVSDDLVLLQTVDFFPPIVDDPYTFGRIAATNALSDIYAMGGSPRIAMNLLCVCPQMQDEDIKALLAGGYEAVYEAGASIAGGHSIQSEEPKYGLSVTGFAHPDHFLRNCSAKEGDVLILTKPLGIGVITTAARAGLADAKLFHAAVENMCQLNRTACEIMLRFDVHSCTDITGFGLLGHCCEMAEGSGVTLSLDASSIPILPGAEELASLGLLPEGMYRNRSFAESRVQCDSQIPLAVQDLLYDPQTSGGLLIAVSHADADALLRALQGHLPVSAIIGCVEARGICDVRVRGGAH